MMHDMTDEEMAQEGREAEAEYLGYCRLVHNVFKKSKDGAKFLNDLVSSTVNRPILHAHSTQFEAGINEGRASIAREIMEMIEVAENQHTTEH